MRAFVIGAVLALTLLSCNLPMMAKLNNVKDAHNPDRPKLLLTYDGNGNTAGALPTGPATYGPGDKVTIHDNTGNLAKPGFTFMGWNSSRDGTGTAYTKDEALVMGEASVVLYAHWASSDKAIMIFAITSPAAMGDIDEAGKKISLTLPYGTSLTALVATFTTTGASVKLGATAQVSGTTPNDFTGPVTYTVTAADGSTQTYTVTVTVATNTAKDIKTFSIGSATGTITSPFIAVTVPYGTAVTSLVASFTTTGASVKVGVTTQVSGTTANDFTSPVTYTVTAADGSTQGYMVTVTVAANTAKAITAFGIGAATGIITGTDIAVTIPYGTAVTSLVASFTTTGASVKVGTIAQTSGSTANDFTSPVTYTVTAADGTSQGYTVTVTVAASPAKDITAYSIGAATGSITGTSIAVTVPYDTAVTALVAGFTTTGASVKVGATAQVSGTTANDFTSPVTYTVTAADGTAQGYVVTVTVAASPAKAITAFSIGAATGSITGTSIAVTVPYGTAVTALVPSFTTTGASVKVGATAQVSGTTANDFTNPVPYTVTAADGSTQSYTITVTVQAVADQYTLTVTAGQGGSASGGGIVSHGDANPITATPDSSYHFAGWTITLGSGVTIMDTAKAATTVTLTGGDANVQANFTDWNYENWTQGSMPSSQQWGGIAYGNGKFVVVSGSVAATSSDGLAWTEHALPRAQNWGAIAFGNNLFVVLANGDWATGNPGSTAKYATSPDGVTWTERDLPISSWWKSLAFGGGTFVALIDGSSSAYTSTDGITWTLRTLPTFGYWYSVASDGGSQFVAPKLDGTCAVYSADGGSTWAKSPGNLPGGSYWGLISYGNGTFIAMTSATIAATSSDGGATWTQRTLPSGFSVNRFAFGNGVFVATNGTAGSFVAVSPDFITWFERSSPGNPSLGAICFGNGTFVAVGSGTSNVVYAATSP